MMLVCIICFFFFFSSRRRHTRFDCDWSSDVCSSDLNILNDRNIFVEATACTNISQDSRSATKPPRCRITKGRAVQVAVPTTWIEIAATRTRSDCCTGNDVRTKVVPQKSATHCWQHPLSHDP